MAGNVGPVIAFRVNGVERAAWEVRATSSFAAYTYTFPKLVVGDAVDLVYTNDGGSASGEDRNLIVNSIVIDGVKVTPSQASVRYDRGSTLAQATDGLDVIAGQELMAWGGALRFSLAAAGASSPAPSAPAPAPVAPTPAPPAPVRGENTVS